MLVQLQARAVGAWIVGVGLHPICLAVYERVHLGGQVSVATLLRLGCAALALVQLLELTFGTLHWALPIGLHAALTGWWIQKVYPASPQSGRTIHPRGAALALLSAVPISIIRWVT